MKKVIFPLLILFAIASCKKDKTEDPQPDNSVFITISNPSAFPMTQDLQGTTLCGGFVICDFKCPANRWDSSRNSPIIDSAGISKIVNGALLENIVNTFGFNSTTCTSSKNGINFFSTTKANNEVTGKVRVLGNFGNCSQPPLYSESYFRSFKFILVRSYVSEDLKTNIAGTYFPVSNQLQTSQ